LTFFIFIIFYIFLTNFSTLKKDVIVKLILYHVAMTKSYVGMLTKG